VRRVQASPHDVVSLSYRQDDVKYPGRARWLILRREGVGEERIWSNAWSSHAFVELLYDYDGPSSPQELLGDTWVTYRPVEAVRMDVGASRDKVLTGGSISKNILVASASAGADWHAVRVLTLHASARYNAYTDGNHALRSNAGARVGMPGPRRTRAWITADATSLNAEHDLDNGYYDPLGYIEAAPGADIVWEPSGAFTFEVIGRFGYQQERGHDWKPLGYGEANLEALLGRGILFDARATRGDSNLSSESGYTRTAASAGLSILF